MSCPSCGQPLPFDAAFCSACGARAGRPGTAPVAAPPAPTLEGTPLPRAPGMLVGPPSAPSAPRAPVQRTLAVVGLVMGLVSLVLPAVGSIAAIITGHLARAEIRRANGAVGGDGLALLGLVLGYSTLVLTFCGLALVFGLLAAVVGASA